MEIVLLTPYLKFVEPRSFQIIPMKSWQTELPEISFIETNSVWKMYVSLPLLTVLGWLIFFRIGVRYNTCYGQRHGRDRSSHEGF